MKFFRLAPSKIFEYSFEVRDSNTAFQKIIIYIYIYVRVRDINVDF